FRAPDVFRDALDDGVVVALRVARWIGHAAKQLQLGLLAIVERAAELERLRLAHAEALLEVVEAVAATDRERGAGQDDTLDAVEEELAQDRANVDRRTGKGEALAVGPACLDPVDLAFQFLAEPLAQLLGEDQAAVGD